MMKLARFGLYCCVALSLAAMAPAWAQSDSVEGRYERLNPPQPTADPSKVEVLEIFWYGCPHCNRFQSYIDPWQRKKPEYVNFVRMPAIFRSSWEIHARAYYTALEMGVLKKTHEQLFAAIHQRRQNIHDRATLKQFFVDQGISGTEFDKNFDSFAVDSGVRRSRVMQERYGIRGVPAVIVNGKYRVSGSVAGSFANMIKVTNVLVDKEHREMLAKQ